MAVVRIQFRRDTYNNWTGSNPILEAGEPAYDTTNDSFKIGDGVTRWEQLTPVSASSADLANYAYLNGSNIFYGDQTITGNTITSGSIITSGTVTSTANIVIGGTGDDFQKGDGTLDSASYETVEAATLKQYLTTGFVEGLYLTINTDNTKFDIASGSYIITDYTDLTTPIPTIIEYPGSTANVVINLTSSNASYIALDLNGDIIQSSSPFTNSQRRSLCTVGAVIHSNRTNINVINEILSPVVGDTNQLHDLMRVIGSLNVEGNVYSPNGANLSLDKSAGEVFGLGINAHNIGDPHVLTTAGQTVVPFRYRLQDGTEYGDTTLVDPTQYDNGGILTTVPNNKFTVQHFNLFQSNITRAQYGQVVYNSLADAKAFAVTDPFITEQNIAENSIFRAYIITKKEITNLTTAIAAEQAHIIIVDKFGSVVGGVATPLTLTNLLATLGYSPENVVNKVTSISAASTNTEYPTAKLLYDTVNNLSGSFSGSVNLTDSAPTSNTDSGTPNEIRVDSGYIYVCTAPNTWKRSPLTSW